MTRSYADLLARGRARWGERFDPSGLEPSFVRWYESEDRVRVAYTIPGDPGAGDTLFAYGTVGVTTGWRPAFLLVHSVRSAGSSYVIGPRDRVVAVKRGRRYLDV